MTLRKKQNHSIQIKKTIEQRIKKHKGTQDELMFWCKKYNFEHGRTPKCICGGTYKMDIMYSKDNKYFGLEQIY